MREVPKKRVSYGEAFWWAHHEAWMRSTLNQREYCEKHDIPLKAFGIWRVVQGRAEAKGGEAAVSARQRKSRYDPTRPGLVHPDEMLVFGGH